MVEVFEKWKTGVQGCMLSYIGKCTQAPLKQPGASQCGSLVIEYIYICIYIYIYAHIYIYTYNESKMGHGFYSYVICRLSGCIPCVFIGVKHVALLLTDCLHHIMCEVYPMPTDLLPASLSCLGHISSLARSLQSTSQSYCKLPKSHTWSWRRDSL